MAVDQLSTLLLKNTSLNEGQVRILLARENKVGISIGATLERNNLTAIEDILAAICRELGLDFMKDIPVNDISVDLIRYIPINYAKNHQILPFKEDIFHDGNVLF